MGRAMNMEFIVPGITAFKQNKRPKVQMPEHSTDNLDLDMSVGEHLLAQRHPLEYDLHVNGITHVVIRDESQEYRYKVVDGQVISQGKF